MVLQKILEITCPFAEKVYCIETENPRALPSKKLAKVARRYVDDVVEAKSVEQALALGMLEQKKVFVAFGSLSFLGEVYHFFS